MKTTFYMALVPLLSACVLPTPAPLNKPVDGSRADLASTQQNGQLTAGVTTREEVLLLLGEPNVHKQEQDEFIYRSTKAVAAYFFIAVSDRGGGVIGKTESRTLRIRFDQNNRIAEIKTEVQQRRGSL